MGLAQLLDLPPETTVGSRAKAVIDAITSVLGADRCSWEARAPHGDDAVVGSDGEVTLHGRRLLVEHAGLLTEGYTAIPARREAQLLGHFRVTASTHVVRPSGEQLRVAVLLADRMAGADLHL